MEKTIDIEKIRKDAEKYYRSEGMYCSEAIVASMRDNFLTDMPESFVATASGFPVGIGRSKCTCGAITGGVMCLGYVFGRTKGQDKEKSEQSIRLAQEIHHNFIQRNRVACCSILTHGMEMGSLKHKDQCVRFTGEVAADVARIFLRELDGVKEVQHLETSVKN